MTMELKEYLCRWEIYILIIKTPLHSKAPLNLYTPVQVDFQMLLCTI